MAGARRALTTRARAALAPVRGYAVVAAGSAGARVLSFAAAVLVARSLGPAEFGDVALFLAVMAVVSTAGDFIDVTYVRHVNTPGTPDATAYLRGALLAKSVMAVLLYAAAFPIAAVLAEAVFRRPELTLALGAAIATGTAIGQIGLLASTYLAQARYAAYSAVQSVFYLVVLAALLALPAAGVATTGARVYAVFAAAALILGVVSVAVLARRAWPLRVERRIVAKILSFAKWLFAANLVQVLYQRLDIVLLARYVDEESVGLYGAALRLGVVATLFVGALAGFLLPRVARTRASREALAAYFRDSALLVAALLVSIAALWAAAPTLVDVLFGPEFAAAAGVARVLLVGTALFALSVPLVQLMLARDVPRQVLVLGVVRLAVVFTLTVVLAPRLGALGAAWAYTASEAAALVYAVAVATRAPRPRRGVGRAGAGENVAADAGAAGSH